MLQNLFQSVAKLLDLHDDGQGGSARRLLYALPAMGAIALNKKFELGLDTTAIASLTALAIAAVTGSNWRQAQSDAAKAATDAATALVPNADAAAAVLRQGPIPSGAAAAVAKVGAVVLVAMMALSPATARAQDAGVVFPLLDDHVFQLPKGAVLDQPLTCLDDVAAVTTARGMRECEGERGACMKREEDANGFQPKWAFIGGGIGLLVGIVGASIATYYAVKR